MQEAAGQPLGEGIQLVILMGTTWGFGNWTAMGNLSLGDLGFQDLVTLASSSLVSFALLQNWYLGSQGRQEAHTHTHTWWSRLGQPSW